MFWNVKQDIIIGFLCDREIGVCSLLFELFARALESGSQASPSFPASRSAIVIVPTDIDIPRRSGAM